jgi:hypothetical protein
MCQEDVFAAVRGGASDVCYTSAPSDFAVSAYTVATRGSRWEIIIDWRNCMWKIELIEKRLSLQAVSLGDSAAGVNKP